MESRDVFQEEHTYRVLPNTRGDRVGDQSLFNKIGSSERLVDRVVNEIQRIIVGGQLEPGMQLPAQRDLAEQIGVSRTALREAVQILVAKGLLTTKPGVGTVVRRMATEQLGVPISLLLQTQGVSLDDLHQVRSILEVEIAALASSTATEQDIAHLKQILAEAQLVQDDPQAFADLDSKFHHVLANATDNPFLPMLLGSIDEVIQGVRVAVHAHPDLARMAVSDHSSILEKIMAKDHVASSQAMREHLQHARTIQKELLAQQETAHGASTEEPTTTYRANELD